MRSAKVTATGAIPGVGKRGRVFGVRILSGTGVAILSVYDGTSNAGPLVAQASAQSTFSGWDNLPENGCEYDNGLYAEISGTGAVGIVYHGSR